MNNKTSRNNAFAKRHPKLNFVIGILLLLSLIAIAGGVLFGIGVGLKRIIEWIISLSSKVDAVIVVALITGAVSISGVVLSSIVAKRIEYKKNREAYLAQKREKP